MGSMTDDRTKVERTSERELVVTRHFDAPPHVVFAAWTTPELFRQWWSPRSLDMPIFSCEMDVRTGGGYRLVFGKDAAQTFAFFGKYIEVVPNERLVWTNEEEEDGAVTTVTFEAQGERTLLTLHELYPSKEALESQAGAEEALPEQFGQLDALLATLGAAG